MKSYLKEFIDEVIELIHMFEYEYIENVNNTHNFLLSTVNEDSCHLIFAAEIVRMAAEYNCKNFAHDGTVFFITIENTTFEFHFVSGWNM